MAVEQQEFYHQLDLSKFVVDDGEIMKSDWTKFAKTHDVKISVNRPFVHKSRGFRPTGKTVFDNKNIYVDNIWNDYIKNLSFYKWTIQEYKRCHNGARPDWAKTYSERGVPMGMRVGKVLDFDKSENCSFLAVERESIDSGSKKKVIVLRFNDYSGNCRRVILIHPNTDNFFIVRQEDWISKSTWKVSSETRLSKDEVAKLVAIS